jgi:hypothetical protein
MWGDDVRPTVARMKADNEAQRHPARVERGRNADHLPLKLRTAAAQRGRHLDHERGRDEPAPARRAGGRRALSLDVAGRQAAAVPRRLGQGLRQRRRGDLHRRRRRQRASIVVVRVSCARALRVAERWTRGRGAHGFRCTQKRHSIDQSVVECVELHGRRGRHRPDEALAFVVRDPAQTPARAERIPEQPSELEALPDDDALPRPEED